MVTLVAFEYQRNYAVRLDGQRIGTAWRPRSGGWKYKALDGGLEFRSTSLRGIKTALSSRYPDDVKERTPRAARTPNLLYCW